MNIQDLKQGNESQPIERNGAHQAKRKNEDDSPSTTHTRSKRNRYISIACNECKRRKIKCNGQVPCQRCGNLQLDCLYAPNCCNTGFKDSDEFRVMSTTIQTLQDQVNNLYHTLEAQRSTQESNVSPYDPQETYPRHPSLTRSTPQGPYQPPISEPQPQRRHTGYKGPTSSAFNFDVANSSLQTMGITEPEIIGMLGPEKSPINSPQQHHTPLSMNPREGQDPLWSVDLEEALRLCGLYEEEMGVMTPLLNIEEVILNVKLLFGSTESTGRAGPTNNYPPASGGLSSDDIYTLRLVLAVALIIEGGGRSDLGKALFDSARKVVESRMWEPVTIKGLIHLALVAQYHFNQDDEIQAYRICGIASRLCLEMGLHRRETLTKAFTTEEECIWALKLFWSIYVADRRFSFATGMPFAIPDGDIDRLLPELDDSTPYLSLSISYARFSSKVWRCTSNMEDVPEISKDMEYLDFQILQWKNTIPPSYRFDVSTDLPPQPTDSRTRLTHKFLLYIRANQMRILIYRPVLHSATSIMENRGNAQKVVEVAKDTIRMLMRLNETSDIYRTQQVIFNYFLISALAVIFLAVSHAPVEFNRVVRDEFYMALDLVKGFSTKSYISQRLWRTIRGLKEVGPKLGLVSRQPFIRDETDPHSSAAVAMAGLAGHPVEELRGGAVYGGSPAQGEGMRASPMNGQQMSYELTTLFEAAQGQTLQGSPPHPPHSSSGAAGPGYANVVPQMQQQHPPPPPQNNDSGPSPYLGGHQRQGELGHAVSAAPGGAREGGPVAVYENGGELSKIMSHLF